MVDVQYSLADVAKITGKSEKTIARWIRSGKLPAVRHGTGYLISGNDIPLRLDPAVNRHDFIQQRLLMSVALEPGVLSYSGASTRGLDTNALVDIEKAVAFVSGGQVDNSSKNLESLTFMLQKLQLDLDKIIREQNELVEKYARVTYTNGQLEERNRQLEENWQESEQKLKLLPLPEQWTNIQEEMSVLKEDLKQKEINFQTQLGILERDLKKIEDEKKELEATLVLEKNKNFWQRLAGLFR
jgi:excisionase family DNA binding protein